jgi:chaperone required for assembly of F1-ATPase
MSDWTVKRFWKEARAVDAADGFAVELDGRPVRTPAKVPLVFPTLALAQAAALEWDAQQGKVDPNTMPVTRAGNASIDKVAVARLEVVEMLAAYADSDLICYRAPHPDELIARQNEAWDPLLDWAHKTYDARLASVVGVVHVPQDENALRRLCAPLYDMTPFEITAMHDLISLSGSLVIGLAAASDHLSIKELWRLSRIDEAFQIEQWGADDEADAQAMIKERAFLDADRFLRLTRE